MKLLLMYSESAKVREVFNKTIYQVISETFGLKDGGYNLKRFDRDFEEFVDVEDVNEIKDKDKIKVISIDLPSASSSSNKPEEPFATSDVKLLVNNNTIKTENEPWPFGIQLSAENFSQPLKLALEAKQNLSSTLLNELLNHLAKFVYLHTPYPNKLQRSGVCEELMKRYPRIDSRIEENIEELEKKLYQKIRKIRVADKLQEEGVKNGSGEKKKRKRSTSEVIVIEDPLEKDEIEKSKELMSESFEKLKTLDWEEIEKSMSATYPFRKNWIVREAPSVMEVKNEYPFFFEVPIQMKEFERLTNLNLINTLKNYFAFNGNRIIECYKEKEPNCEYVSMFMREGSNKTLLELQNYSIHFALMLLPKIFEEDGFLTNPSAQSDFPMIKSLDDDVYGPFAVEVENISVMQTSEFVEAVAYFFSLFFTLNIRFPVSIKTSLYFLQYCIFHINEGKIPRKVKTFQQTLDNIPFNIIV